MFRHLLALAGATMIMSCAGAGPDETGATLEHDFGRRGTLHAYAAEPAAERRSGDEATARLTGLPIKSPRTPYVCTWQDTGQRRASGERNFQPEEMSLDCRFGSEPWVPPRSSDQEAIERVQREEAQFRALWRRDGAEWRLIGLEAEVRQPGSSAGFRSLNAGRDLAEVQLRESDIAFPRSHSASVRFRIVASLPRRPARGGIAVAPRATLTLAGAAQPKPDWLFRW